MLAGEHSQLLQCVRRQLAGRGARREVVHTLSVRVASRHVCLWVSAALGRAADRCKAWRQRNPGYMSAYCRAWRERKREEALAAQQAAAQQVAVVEE